GKLSGKYALTSVGAGQYFGYIAKGLGQTVRFMLTDDQGHSVAPDAVYPLVSKIVNQLVRHRQDALIGCRAILSEDRCEFDGFVGRSYCLVSNDEIHSHFTLACEMLRGNPQFYSASINGRD